MDVFESRTDINDSAVYLIYVLGFHRGRALAWRGVSRVATVSCASCVSPVAAVVSLPRADAVFEQYRRASPVSIISLFLIRIHESRQSSESSRIGCYIP